MLKDPVVVYTDPEKTTISTHGENLAQKDFSLYNEIIELRRDGFKTPDQIRSILDAGGFSLRRRVDGKKGFILERKFGFTHIGVIEEIVMEENTMAVLGWEVRQDSHDKIAIKEIRHEVGRGSEDFNPRKGWLCDVISFSVLLDELL
ncbi:hypothetical protein PQC06_gp128 [Aeromonas phage LAh10]|uniref:Uncharacterized protein n=1 Tax=Aeromonas phage LAh10 TaxID=2591025 RepID=A0A514A1M8_9CAUD|nr:hypothetical protein PQC06_gp128 [Aeromonas phage LAh10]QDH47188.1 hypothetical protein LAh10_128 [Aeromonas phage LAh10]